MAKTVTKKRATRVSAAVAKKPVTDGSTAVAKKPVTDVSATVAKKPGRRVDAFNAALVPLTMGLPAQIAASLGVTIGRHSHLDWVLGQVMYSLMEISIKQGRVIMKMPRPAHYIAAVRDLFQFHGLEGGFDFDDLCERLDTADRSRNMLTRSVYMRDTSSKAMRVQLVRSPWDPGPGGETQPEAQLVDRKFLARRRKDVDDAIKAAEKLQAVTDKQLRRMHELRRQRPGMDRRRR